MTTNMDQLLAIICTLPFVYAVDTYSITPEGKVWDFDAIKQEWNILNQSSLSMSVRM